MLDAELAELGVRGRLEPDRPTGERRTCSTRRLQDAPNLPKKTMAETTLGRTFTGNGGTVYRPSMFVTVTNGSTPAKRHREVRDDAEMEGLVSPAEGGGELPGRRERVHAQDQ